MRCILVVSNLTHTHTHTELSDANTQCLLLALLYLSNEWQLVPETSRRLLPSDIFMCLVP